MILNSKNRNFQVVAMLVVSLMTAPAMAQQGRSEAHRAAFEECREQLGLEKPVAGERPVALEDSVRDQLDACMKEKGFAPPKFGRRGPHGGQRSGGGEEGGNNSNNSGVQ